MWLFEGSHYLYPSRAYLMLAIPCIALLFWWLSIQRQTALKLFFGYPLASTLADRRSRHLIVLRTLLLCLAWMLITLALMVPYSANSSVTPMAHQNSPQEQKTRRLMHDVILLVDASASMAIQDGRSGESRLTSAKQICDELLAHMHGESVALYAFTSELIPEAPLTFDYLFLRLMLRQLSINPEDTAGTDFLSVLSALRGKYWEGKELSERAATLIIVSDGGDTTWESLQGKAQSDRLQAIVDMVRIEGLQVITVGVGSSQASDVPNVQYRGQPVPSALEETLLRSLATVDGAFLLARENSSLETSRQIAVLLASHDRYKNVHEALTRLPTAEAVIESHYHYPLTLAILSLIAALLMPWRFQTTNFPSCLVLGTLLIPSLAMADDAFTERQAQAKRATLFFEAQRYKSAQAIYENLLKQDPQPWEAAILHYNLGTIALAEGQWLQAYKEFESVNLAQEHPAWLAGRVVDNRTLALIGRIQQLLTDLPNTPQPDVSIDELQTLLAQAKQAYPQALPYTRLVIKNLESEINRQSEAQRIAELTPMAALYAALAMNAVPDLTPHGPDQWLEMLLHMQESIGAISRTIMSRKIGSTSFSGSELSRIIMLQDRVLILGDAFIKSVLNQEKRGYATKECQEKPWDQVLPHFFEGHSHATQANRALKEQNVDWMVIQKSQQGAVLQWRLALKALRSHQAVEKNHVAKQPNLVKDTSTKQLPMSSAIQLLEQMESEDRPAKPPSAQPSGVLRPW